MKDYKKILEGVVNIIKTSEKSDIGFNNICAYIGENCPELKESEDERMWKLIKKYAHSNISDLAINADNITRKELESWLEKKSQVKESIISQQENKICKESDDSLTSGDERIRKAIIDIINNGYSEYAKEFTHQDLTTWLEKKGNIDLEFFENDENEKREFVGYGFLKCKGDFLSFKEGETYWLEYMSKDNYNVRSDNLLGQTFHITPQQLYTVFRPTTWLEKKGKEREQLINKACDLLVNCIEDFMLRRMEIWNEECKKQTLENIRKKLEE